MASTFMIVLICFLVFLVCGLARGDSSKRTGADRLARIERKLDMLLADAGIGPSDTPEQVAGRRIQRERAAKQAREATQSKAQATAAKKAWAPPPVARPRPVAVPRPQASAGTPPPIPGTQKTAAEDPVPAPPPTPEPVAEPEPIPEPVTEPTPELVVEMPTDPGDVDLRIREVPPSPESGDSDGAKPASTDDRWANREKRWQDTSRNW